jgi:hypothetical protein
MRQGWGRSSAPGCAHSQFAGRAGLIGLIKVFCHTMLPESASSANIVSSAPSKNTRLFAPCDVRTPDTAVRPGEEMRSSKSPDGHWGDGIYSSYSEDQMPVMPRAFRELARASVPQSDCERCLSHLPKERPGIFERPDVHDLSDDAMGTRDRSFRRLPPNIFTGEIRQVHGLDFTTDWATRGSPLAWLLVYRNAPEAGGIHVVAFGRTKRCHSIDAPL